MSQTKNNPNGRRRFLTGVGLAATTATLASAGNRANAAESGTFRPARHAEDAWLDANDAIHRVFLDTSAASGGITALNYASNILIGHAEGYGGEESDYAIVVCFRHGSTPLGYNDAMWSRYGVNFSQIMGLTDPQTNEPFRVNPLNMQRSDMANRGNTIESMIARGVSYAICRRATRSFSARLARATGGDVDDIFTELMANNVPSSRFVPAGVVAATRSQEYGYSLLFSA